MKYQIIAVSPPKAGIQLLKKITADQQSGEKQPQERAYPPETELSSSYPCEQLAAIFDDISVNQITGRQAEDK